MSSNSEKPTRTRGDAWKKWLASPEWSKLKTWIEEQLKNHRVPRLSSIARMGTLIHKLPTKHVVRKLVTTTIPAYIVTTPRPYKPKDSRSFIASSIGHFSSDLAFLGKSSRALSNIGIPAGHKHICLVNIDILSRKVYLVPLNSKDTRSLILAFKTLFQRVQDDGYRVLSILFDQERAVLSREMGIFLDSHHVDLRVKYISRTKSSLSEATINLIRRNLSKFEQSTGDVFSSASPAQAYDRLERTFNEKEMIIYGKRMGFTPNDITLSNQKTLLDRMKLKIPFFYFAQFQINPKSVPDSSWLYKKGDRVYLKQSAVSVAVLKKQSVRTITQDLFLILKRYLWVERNNKIVRGYIIRHLKSGRIIYTPEAAIVLTMEEDDE
jgi:hypothetical protein